MAEITRPECYKQATLFDVNVDNRLQVAELDSMAHAWIHQTQIAEVPPQPDCADRVKDDVMAFGLEAFITNSPIEVEVPPPNVGPVIDFSIDPVVIQEGSVAEVLLTAEDSEGQVVAIRVLGGTSVPAWITLLPPVPPASKVMTRKLKIAPALGNASTRVLQIEAEDNQGALSQRPLSVVVTAPPVDVIPPTLTVTTSLEGVRVVHGSCITISGTASDNLGLASVALAVSYDGPDGPFSEIVLIPVTGLSSPWTYSWTIPFGDPVGADVWLRVTAKDVQQNTSTRLQGPFEVDWVSPTATVVVKAPPVTGVVKVSGDDISSGVPLAAVMTIVDPEAGTHVVTWTLTVPVGSGSVLNTTSGLAVSFVPDIVGEYRLHASVQNLSTGKVVVFDAVYNGIL